MGHMGSLLPDQGIEPAPSALEGKELTTGLAGKSPSKPLLSIQLSSVQYIHIVVQSIPRNLIIFQTETYSHQVVTPLSPAPGNHHSTF